ncbi:hypothetical protein [Fusobacterium polymorphum]|uniref:hypothetical protein n=1 Tax=Fusobacterium nucleatum subsp. polymorphum TaxID=76857 RepID=UPI003009DE62
MAVSESQKKANKSYREKNPKRNQYLSYRSTARGFINNHATLEDLDDLKALILKRELHLKREE